MISSRPAAAVVAGIGLGRLPWLLAGHPDFSPPYMGLHNDLSGLVKERSRNNWVTIFIYNEGM